MTDEQVEAVRAALEALEAVAQDHDSPEFWELHRDVPLGAARAGRDRVDPARARAGVVASQRYVRLFVSETVDDAMADHRELLEYCEQRDGGARRASSCAGTSIARSSRCARRSRPPTRPSAG